MSRRQLGTRSPSLALDAEAEAFEDVAAAGRRARRCRQAPRCAPGSKCDASCSSTGGSPARVTSARLAAANVEDQAGQDREAIVEEGRVDAALEPAARIAGQLQRLAGAGDPLGREIGDLEQDVGGRLGDAANARRP